jgi:hypothetical protein
MLVQEGQRLGYQGRPGVCKWLQRSISLALSLVGRGNLTERSSRAYMTGRYDDPEASSRSNYGPTRRTLRQFITACSDLDALVREFMTPNPDRALPWSPSARHLQELPDTGQSFERRRPKILERDAGTGHKVAHRAGDPNLAPIT